MNASVHLLRQVVPASVQLRAAIPEEHPSAAILGAERMGTGTIVEPTGHIVTAHYLLVGARTVEVTFIDGATREADVLGIDFATGLGVVRLVTDHVPAALEVRSVDDVKVGEDVFLVAAVADGRRVSDGAVSSIGLFEAFWEYMLENGIMSTASNPGFGGGPLVDVHGKMIGVVALSLAEVGKFTLAVPASCYLPLGEALSRGGSPGGSPRPWVGLTCYSLRNHVIIASLLPGSPGEQAGLRAGDVVLAIEETAVSDRRTLYTELWRRHPGDTIRFRVFRNNRAQEVQVVTQSAEQFFR